MIPSRPMDHDTIQSQGDMESFMLTDLDMLHCGLVVCTNTSRDVASKDPTFYHIFVRISCVPPMPKIASRFLIISLRHSTAVAMISGSLNMSLT